MDKYDHHVEVRHLVHVVPHDDVERLIEEWLKEHGSEAWMHHVSWNVCVDVVDDCFFCPVLDFLGWTVDVCPSQREYVLNVTGIGDEAVGVVVKEAQVENVELAWVAEVVPQLEEGFWNVLWSSP